MAKPGRRQAYQKVSPTYRDSASEQFALLPKAMSQNALHHKHLYPEQQAVWRRVK